GGAVPDLVNGALDLHRGGGGRRVGGERAQEQGREHDGPPGAGGELAAGVCHPPPLSPEGRGGEASHPTPTDRRRRGGPAPATGPASVVARPAASASGIRPPAGRPPARGGYGICRAASPPDPPHKGTV